MTCCYPQHHLTAVCMFKQIGDMISSKGGVVSAEELAPYLDVPSYSEETKASYFLPDYFGLQ